MQHGSHVTEYIDFRRHAAGTDPLHGDLNFPCDSRLFVWRFSFEELASSVEEFDVSEKNCLAFDPSQNTNKDSVIGELLTLERVEEF